MKQPADPHPREVLDVLRRRGPETCIAVVGASSNPQKYGNIILKNLAGKGYTVVPVNPKEKEIEGKTVYPTLADAPGPIHIVDLVTPAGVTLKVLEQVAALGLPAVFLQPGTYDDAVLAYAADAPFKTVYEACIMVAAASA